MEKIAKICWNNYKWTKPSGTEGKSPNKDTYENASGYGHEEWLLDKARIIDGYHYGFLQPLNLKTDRHVGEKYKIWLYTIYNGNKLLIGHINNTICISKDESAEVYFKYKKQGWLKEMTHELEMAGIHPHSFKDTSEKIFVNVKFKIADIFLYDEFPVIDKKDINITTTRFKLLDKKHPFVFVSLALKGTDAYTRKAVAGTSVDPYHNKVQNALVSILSKSGGYTDIIMEKNGVDVQAKHNGEPCYFEIKTDTPKNNIRQAIGQLLEYSLYPDTEKAKKLIIIGDAEPETKTKTYMKYLRSKTSLNLFYRWIDMESEILSEEI